MPKNSSNSVRIFYPKRDRKELVESVRGKLTELNERLPLSRVVLFGSYVSGNYTVASDVDLLVVYKGQPKEDAFKIVKKSLPVDRLEPHVYQEDEFEKSKEVLNKMTENGIVLWD